jgi:hypothetical protein
MIITDPLLGTNGRIRIHVARSAAFFWCMHVRETLVRVALSGVTLSSD